MATEVNTYNDYSIAATEAVPLISNFNFWMKPELGSQIFDINPLESDWGDFMKMGLMVEVNSEEVIHQEAASLFDVPIVKSSTTQSDVFGTQATGDFAGYEYLVLAPESHSPSTGTHAGKFSYPRQGQHIMFSNNSEWRIAGVDKNTAFAHKLFLQKVQTSMATLAQTITQTGSTWGGNRFIIPHNSWEEATRGQQEGLVPAPKSYTSWLQTFTEKYKVTDLAQGNKTYPIKWHNEIINFTYPLGIENTEIRMAAAMDNGLFLANKDDGNLSNIDPETGEAKSVYTTNGYVQNLESNAQKLYYDTTPGVTLFRQIARFRRAQMQGGKVMIFAGAEAMFTMEDLFSALGVNGAMLYNRKAVDLGVETIKTGGVTYFIKPLTVLDHPKFAGAPGFPYPHYFIVAPMDKIADPKTNIPRNAFQIIYKKAYGVGARGWYKMWETGANSQSGSGVDGQAIRRIHIWAHLGMQVAGASKHILGKRVAA